MFGCVKIENEINKTEIVQRCQLCGICQMKDDHQMSRMAAMNRMREEKTSRYQSQIAANDWQKIFHRAQQTGRRAVKPDFIISARAFLTLTFWCTHFSDGDLEYAHRSDTDFECAHLCGAELKCAHLFGTDFAHTFSAL